MINGYKFSRISRRRKMWADFERRLRRLEIVEDKSSAIEIWTEQPNGLILSPFGNYITRANFNKRFPNGFRGILFVTKTDAKI